MTSYSTAPRECSLHPRPGDCGLSTESLCGGICFSTPFEIKAASVSVLAPLLLFYVRVMPISFTIVPTVHWLYMGTRHWISAYAVFQAHDWMQEQIDVLCEWLNKQLVFQNVNSVFDSLAKIRLYSMSVALLSANMATLL